ncbi:MAG: ATP-dependent RecD-like DNA helicase [Ruminococcaceae bacterium]|nr:ATP-dependent RecD-like DNA helicase [Oscillospiraceae bacterium]
MEDNKQEFEVVKGTVERITYRNDQNGYTVANLSTGGEKIVIVGMLPFLNEGESGVFNGNYIVHPSYGRQFAVESFERTAPQTTAGILRYLSSGVIKGVGPTTAGRIVEKFGEETLDIIQNHPEELASIKGISIEKAYAISGEYEKQFGIRDIMILLSSYSVSPDICLRIYRALGTDAVEKIKSNPYILCREDIGFGFERAEQIASDFEISPDNEMRLFAGIEYILRKNLMNGHTCLPRYKLVAVAVNLLESDELRISDICDRMISRFIISSVMIGDTEFLALPEYYAAEDHIAARLFAVKRNISKLMCVEDLEIDYVENKLGIKFEQLQRKAIKQAFESGILILTGGPGTGKTTTLNAIIELFESRKAIIELAAPTGRAAKRMTELTGREAKTLHRLLEVNWGANERQEFCRNEKNPLDCDVIVVDEASMIDTLLFDNLLRALRLSCRIILVGDVDQLPSVSAGNVLGDLLAADIFPSISLKKVFRQAGESTIVTNAHAIINETPIDLSNKGKDFFMMQRANSYDVCNTVLELCCERLPKAYNFDPLTDIQVLCPSRKADCGTLNLNNLLQSCLNPPKKDEQSFSYKGVFIRKGDKVMQIKNNYDIEWQKDNGEIGTGVFNGDVGYVCDADKRSGVLKVRFEDRVVSYYGEEIGELELAYAVTVHKSQGSEFDCVIIPVFDVPSQLRYRNLLYTGVTRAKKMLIIVGSEGVFYEMVENNRKMLRYTMLQSFLHEC